MQTGIVLFTHMAEFVRSDQLTLLIRQYSVIAIAKKWISTANRPIHESKQSRLQKMFQKPM